MPNLKSFSIALTLLLSLSLMHCSQKGRLAYNSGFTELPSYSHTVLEFSDGTASHTIPNTFEHPGCYVATLKVFNDNSTRLSAVSVSMDDSKYTPLSMVNLNGERYLVLFHVPDTSFRLLTFTGYLDTAKEFPAKGTLIIRDVSLENCPEWFTQSPDIN